MRALLLVLPALACPGLSHAQNCLQREVDPNPVTAGQLGASVAIDEPYAVAGAPVAGHVQVYRRGVGGEWNALQTLETPPGQPGVEFGSCVDVEGNTLVVGDREADRAFVYKWNAGTQSFEFLQALVSTDLVAGDNFGQDVSIQGSDVFVSAMRDDDMGVNSGSVYRFTQVAGVYNQTQKITAFDGQVQDFYGVAIDTEGARLVVGSVYDNDLGSDSGSVYVYQQGGSGDYDFEQKLVASDGQADDYFGVAVAIDGSRIVVGAEGDDDNGSFSGSAYVFLLTSQWDELAKLTAWDGVAGDDFGFSVACSGEWVHVGARAHNNAYGAVYRICVFNNGTVIPVNKFEPIGPSPAETFGAAVDMDSGAETSGIIGAQGHAAGPYAGAGAVYFVRYTSSLVTDCDGDFIDDFCEIYSGIGTDVNDNGLLDECETIGVVGCSPNSANSTGDWGKLLIFGSDVVAQNDVTLRAFDLPANQFAIFITGQSAGFTPFPSGGQGILCLSGQIGRYSSILNTGTQGSVSMAIDLNVMPMTPVVPVLPGQTWIFQTWHRDLNPFPVSTSNFSESVTVVFQ